MTAPVGGDPPRPSPGQFDPAWLRLDGRVALVTGGAQGIGRAIAVGFARAGAAVAVLDITGESAEATAAAIRDAGGRAFGLAADVRDPAALAAAVAETEARLGAVGVLVSNAGIQVRKPLLEASEEEIRRLVDTNLLGVIHSARAVGPGMIARGGGCIVNTGSISAIHGMVSRVVYSATKAGIAGLTRALAMEWGRYGVRVNALGPGIIATPLLADYLAANPERRRRAESEVPLGRIGVPDDVVGAALFLASDAAAYITGQTIYVDGGLVAGDTWW